MTIFASFLLSAALAAGAPAPDIDRQEPISLDLKDASVTDVITMLGALANTPVSIAPDVTGTVTIKVEDVPYEKVLEMIGAQNAISLRFEGGKLVATRSQAAPAATGSSVPAPRAERAGPRLSVNAYAAAASASGKPLIVSVRAYGAQTCARVDGEKGGSYEVSLPRSADSAVVTQFGWDAVTRTRFVAVEAPGSAPKAFALSDSQGLAIESRPDGAAGWSTSPEPPARSCREVAPGARTSAPGSVTIHMTVTDLGRKVVLEPHVRTPFSKAFSVRSGQMGVSGQHDEVILVGYVAADGKSVAVALQATAIRTDAREKREYVYSQVSPAESVRFTTLGGDPVVVGSLPVGPARDRPLELSAWITPTP